MDKRYLLLRKRGWYVRYAIPQKAQHYFGKTEFVVSLKTRSLEEAKIRKLRYLESFSNAINSYLSHSNIDGVFQDSPEPLSIATYKHSPNQNYPDLKESNLEIKRFRLSILLGEFLGEQSKVLTKYTCLRKQNNIENLIEFLGDININSLDKPTFREYFDQEIVPQNLSRNTVLGKLNDIGSLFNWALRRGIIQSNPLKGFGATLPLPRKTNSHHDANQPLSRRMLFDLLCHIQEEDELFNTTLLGIYTGMRIEEICRLKTTDIESECLLIREGKTQSAPRKIPIHKSILPLIATMIASTQDGYLIEGLKIYRGKRSHSISKRLGTRRKQLGFDRGKYTFHSLRANFVTELDNQGVDLSIIQSLIGHRQQSLVRSIYSGGPKIEKLREIVNKIDYGSEIISLVQDAATIKMGV